jgi:hypothetical protein
MYETLVVRQFKLFVIFTNFWFCGMRNLLLFLLLLINIIIIVVVVTAAAAGGSGGVGRGMRCLCLRL